MRILLINHEYPPIGGGGGYAGYNLLRLFAGRDDVAIDAVVSNPHPATAMERFAENITLHRVGVRKKAMQFWTRWEMVQWIRHAGKLCRRLMAENAYDVVHAFFGFPGGMVAWRTAGRVPYLVSLRGSDVPGANARFALDYKILGPLFRRIWRGSAGLYACSDGLRERALRFLGDVAVGVVANGVDAERYSPSGRAIDPRAPRLLSVGRMSASKRMEVVIAAAEMLRASRPGTTLTLAGGGGLLERTRELVRSRGLENFVRVEGVVPAERMGQVYREHDMLVTATMQEGMSNAMLEAMASGLPIVTTRCEGVAELIGENGIVLDSAEPAAMADAVASLCEPAAHAAAAAAARRQAMRFTWQAAAEAYIGIYRELSGKGGGRA